MVFLVFVLALMNSFLKLVLRVSGKVKGIKVRDENLGLWRELGERQQW